MLVGSARVSTGDQKDVLKKDPETTVGKACKAVGVSSATLYRCVGPDGTIRKMP